MICENVEFYSLLFLNNKRKWFSFVGQCETHIEQQTRDKKLISSKIELTVEGSGDKDEDMLIPCGSYNLNCH